MHVHVHRAFLPHLDPASSLVLYSDTLGLEVREDVGSGAMRWLTFGPGVGCGPALVLGPPVSSPGVTDEEHRTVRALMAKGVYAGVALATADLAGAFERLASCAPPRDDAQHPGQRSSTTRTTFPDGSRNEKSTPPNGRCAGSCSTSTTSAPTPARPASRRARRSAGAASRASSPPRRSGRAADAGSP
ncbi:hypothetical protein CBZ_07900 [Cellulomonas biazotea]|uniref:Glyoxalase/fosfomycin resistance/dioxygenase domain-containing protein n=1 Tax=Cellulomonas biazotea TaxID=1709 RepID=A0A402DNN9_9CELL|nr:hypothetical protein CBZ_07900 [Cellulomonas biazotea]